MAVLIDDLHFEANRDLEFSKSDVPGTFSVAASRNIWSGSKFRNDIVRHSQAQLDECFTLAFHFSV
jgi:hypothetical protein